MMSSKATSSPEVHHLCVLVHGLWGNPGHVQIIAECLRERYQAENFHILVAKTNCGSRTYDGIALGGERLCQEIQDELQRLADNDQTVQHFSIVGYSLGGLVGRYAIGLLESQGLFETIIPVNFTAFASPFLGTRNPLQGWRSDIANVLGPYAFCKSGRELFMLDNFRETGRPLLEVLADPESVFMKGLSRFQRRSLYGNIVNDPSAVYYTSTISKTDPYGNLDDFKPSYVKGYDNVIVDVNGPVTSLEDTESGVLERMIQRTPTKIYRFLFFLGMTVFIPIFSTILFVTSIVQSVKSPRRIELHEKGLAGVQVDVFDVPLFIANHEKSQIDYVFSSAQKAAEDVYQSINNAQSHEYLLGAAVEKPQARSTNTQNKPKSRNVSRPINVQKAQAWKPREFPTLALTPVQLNMAANLNSLGWRKYPVHIHKVRRAHAAMIMRIGGASFSEGKVVLRHWLDQEFIP